MRHAREHRPSRAKGKLSTAAWFFGVLTFALFAYAFCCPYDLPDYKHKMLAVLSALVSALFTYLLASEAVLNLKSVRTPLGEVSVGATGAAAVFIAVLVWWSSAAAPVLSESQSTSKKAQALRDDLMMPADLMSNLSNYVPRPLPSAVSLADRIPHNADSYTAALKAIALSRFDEASRLLDLAERNGEASPGEIAEARAQLESWRGNVEEAAGHFREAASRFPDDSEEFRRLRERAEVLRRAWEKSSPTPPSP